MRAIRLLALIASLLAAPVFAADDLEQLAAEVRAAESGFAASMAERNFERFASFVADDAIFFGAEALRGKEAVLTAWKQFFEGDAAPFSWAPEQVEVLESGQLAHSSGPVFTPDGERAATFNSIWRRGADGRWLVIFDKGCDACTCAAK
jgi:ketosteroid isomerase-like protein